MKRYFLLTMLLSPAFFGQVYSQHHILTGKVTDNKGRALPHATVAVRPLTDTNSVFSSRADSTGVYRLNNLFAGRYAITASFLGYIREKKDTILIRHGERITHFDLVMLAAATNLSGVTIRSARPSVTAEKGKIVLNVQNAANGAGQTALDILSRIPGVSVDGEGNISYGNTAGVNIMVNGRMTWLSGAQLASYLKGISAEDIGKVEMIASPDASFDAAGNAGIINIVSRKKPVHGLALDLRSAVSAGKYLMTNQNAALNYNSRRISLYGLFDYNIPHRFIRRSGGNLVPGTDNMINLRRSTESGYKIQYYTWRAGIEWKLHPRHTLTLNYHGYLDDFTCFHQTDLHTIHRSGAMQSSIRSLNNIVEPYYYDAVNLSYKYDIDSTGKKISMDADYTAYRNYSDALMTMQYFQPDGNLSGENQLSSYQPGFVKIKSIKTDAELPFQHLLLKAGLKYAEVSNDNNYRFDSLKNGNVVEIDNISNHFKYSERIAAAYISADRRINKTNLSLGLRVEHTQATGFTVRQGVSNNWRYTQLFPSLTVEQSLNDIDQLSISIGRRINRPTYTDLNPVRWYRDQYFYYSGNPGLVPELAWNISLAYSLSRKYIFTLAYRHSNRHMSEQLAFDVYSPAIKSQRANFGKLHRVEATTAVPLSVLRGWELQWNSNLSCTTYPIAMTVGEKQLFQLAAAFSLQQDFSLPAGFKATLSSYFTTAELRGIYRTRPVYYHDVGIKKAFLQTRLNIQLSVNDIFNTSRQKGYSMTDVTDFWYDDKPDSRRVGLSVTYHFGGKSMKPSNRKTEEQERL